MRLPTNDNPEPCRKPDNRSEVFADGDFADFIKPIFDTLDLYHNQDVDPRAIAVSWKRLVENNPDANLRFASMEVKGEDNLLLRLKTAPNADFSQLNADYFDTYNQIKALTEAEFKQQLIAEKDNRIQKLESMVNTALTSQKIYVENNNHQEGINMTSEKRETKAETYNEQSGNFGIGSMSGGEIKDNTKVAGVINESEKQNLAEAATEIQKLLQQLEQSNPTATEAEKIAYINDETSPSFKRRTVSALKAGGETAIEEFLDNPYVNVGKAVVKGWMKPE